MSDVNNILTVCNRRRVKIVEGIKNITNVCIKNFEN